MEGEIQFLYWNQLESIYLREKLNNWKDFVLMEISNYVSLSYNKTELLSVLRIMARGCTGGGGSGGGDGTPPTPWAGDWGRGSGSGGDDTPCSGIKANAPCEGDDDDDDEIITGPVINPLAEEEKLNNALGIDPYKLLEINCDQIQQWQDLA